jgi:hypothetical protein
MGVPIEGLVHQAIFNWAKLHGYLEPGRVEPAPRAEPGEPETTRVPVVADLDSTSPSRLALRRIFLVLVDREVEVTGTRFLIGRDVSCDLSIDSVRMSRQHAVILVGPDEVVLEDLRSSNGSWYQGHRLERRKLVHGDELRFGDTAVRVEFR